VPNDQEQLLDYRVRPMRLDDVDQVVAIERLSFPSSWSPETYRRELRHSSKSRYLVAERLGEPSIVVGYGGYWLIGDEAHISTLAVHPVYRRHGLGEYLLASMLLEAVNRGAHMATLEVRVSNTAAQALYCKYGFHAARRRRRYYRDNDEDALVMNIESMHSEAYRELFAKRWQDLMSRFHTPTLNTTVPAGQECPRRVTGAR